MRKGCRRPADAARVRPSARACRAPLPRPPGGAVTGMVGEAEAGARAERNEKIATLSALPDGMSSGTHRVLARNERSKSYMETVKIGGMPYEEDCAQIGITGNSGQLNELECEAYIAALRAVYGRELSGAELRVESHAHDFGTYREVVCSHEPTNESASTYAKTVERGLATWDEGGLWAPVVYHQSQPIHIIRDPRAWIRSTNPGAHRTISSTSSLS